MCLFKTWDSDSDCASAENHKQMQKNKIYSNNFKYKLVRHRINNKHTEWGGLAYSGNTNLQTK